MSDGTPELTLGGSGGGGREEIVRLVQSACDAYAARNTRKAADALCAAESAATHQRFFREAAKIRQAIAILAQGGKPRLLLRGTAYLDRERDD